MENTYNKHLAQHNIYDIRVSHSIGVTQGDLDIINKMDNIDKLETYYTKKATNRE